MRPIVRSPQPPVLPAPSAASPVVVTLPLNQSEGFPCRKCFDIRVYKTHNDLKRHLGKKHPDTELVFRCHLCQQDVANVRGYLAHIKSRECTGNRKSNALLPSSAVNGRAQPQPAAETNLPDGSEMPLNSGCVEAPRSSGGATPLTTPPANVSRGGLG